MQCPKCQFDCSPESPECARCGVIFARYRGTFDPVHQTGRVAGSDACPEPSDASAQPSVAAVSLAAAAAAPALAGVASSGESRSSSITEGAVNQDDLDILLAAFGRGQLPGDPPDPFDPFNATLALGSGAEGAFKVASVAVVPGVEQRHQRVQRLLTLGRARVDLDVAKVCARWGESPPIPALLDRERRFEP